MLVFQNKSIHWKTILEYANENARQWRIIEVMDPQPGRRGHLDSRTNTPLSWRKSR